MYMYIYIYIYRERERERERERGGRKREEVCALIFLVYSARYIGVERDICFDREKNSLHSLSVFSPIATFIYIYIYIFIYFRL